MTEGRTTTEIAKTLYISPHTARHHIEKIGVNAHTARTQYQRWYRANKRQ